MKNKPQALTEAQRYQAPMIYLGIFYAMLVAWTIICIYFIGFKVTRSELGNLFQLFMFAFIIAMTWYFSMGISYRINIEEDGTVQLTSFRRILRVHSRKMELIEGPHLPIGFIRFRLEREKAYLFCLVRDEELQKSLLAIWKANPDIKFKNLSLNS
jgi:energy-coupling factor transporter transmembrane protein EcfT